MGQLDRRKAMQALLQRINNRILVLAGVHDPNVFRLADVYFRRTPISFEFGRQEGMKLELEVTA